MLPVGGKGLTRISHPDRYFRVKTQQKQKLEPWLLMTFFLRVVFPVEKIEIAALVGLQHAVLK
jgi:hypothetical protein